MLQFSMETICNFLKLKYCVSVMAQSTRKQKVDNDEEKESPDQRLTRLSKFGSSTILLI